MKIAIIGATGTAGRATTRSARQAGYDVITLSRATGIDLHTGEGLTSALDGADVAIDTSNPFPVSADADLVATFRDATARVVRACQHAGVDRLVHLSICNIDDPAFDEFDYYLAKREERHEQEEQSRQRALNLYRRELEWMRRQPQARGTKAQYRIDAFHELEVKTRPAQRTEEVQLGASSTRIGKKIFEAHHVNKRFGDKVLLQDFNYVFSRYDKVGIIGENGVGKTTFLRMLLGEIEPDSGHFDIGETIRFGYYSQEPPTFAPEKRVIDIVQEIAENFELPAGSTQVERLSASQILTRFLFPPERQYTPVEKLSGGELRRLYLCTVLVTCPNFLVLDEPTNDLDILTLQALEEYLADFAGCVLIVSHDRFFMDKVVNHLFTFEGAGVIRDFPGSYTLYRMKREEEERQKAEASQPRKAAPQPAESRRTANRPARLTYAERRELEEITARIPQLNEEKTSLEAKLSTGTLSHEDLMKASERIGELIEEMDLLTLRQLELEEKEA